MIAGEDGNGLLWGEMEVVTLVVDERIQPTEDIRGLFSFEFTLAGGERERERERV